MGSLFYYKYVFMVELLVIEGMFATKLRRRRHFALRLAGSLFVLFGVVTLFGTVIPFVFHPLFVSFMFLLFFLLTVAAMAFCFRDTLWNILFCCFAAYTVQHIAYLIYTLVANLLLNSGAGNGYTGAEVAAPSVEEIAINVVIYLACYIMVYAEAYFLLISMIPKKPDLQLGRSSLVVISALVVIVNIVFNMYTVYNESADELSVFLEEVYNLISCLLVLQMQFQKLRQKQILEDYDVVNRILQQERQQFKRLKENMNIINVKCHDLKHQLRAIRHGSAVDPVELKTVEQAIAIYQTVAHTGNETLDIVLTDKMLFCEQNGIEITCIADGKAISFMGEEDVYSLFGNALDNAVTAVEKLPQSDREIWLRINDFGDVVTIRVENKFTGKLRIEDGVPVTTKKDTAYHGFGIMSMQMIAAKYGGKLNVEVKENRFILTITFTNVSELKRELKQEGSAL